jgi:hypothetical protein
MVAFASQGVVPQVTLAVVGIALNRPRLYNFSFHVCRRKIGAGFSVPSTTQIDLSYRQWGFPGPERCGKARHRPKKGPWRGAVL